MSAVGLSRLVCCVAQQKWLLCMSNNNGSCVRRQTCLPCHTADNICCVAAGMSSVSGSRQVRCVTHQAAMSHSRQCLLCHIANMPAVSHSRHICCVTRPTLLLCHAADSVCCVSQQTRLPCHMADDVRSVTQQTRLPYLCCVANQAMSAALSPTVGQVATVWARPRAEK